MFISNAYAQSSVSVEQQILSFLPIILIFVAMYFLTIRPHTKRLKQHKILLDGLKVGDEVLLSSGFVGKIIKMGGAYLTLCISSSLDAKTSGHPVEVYVQKSSVQTLLPNGTIRGLS